MVNLTQLTVVFIVAYSLLLLHVDSSLLSSLLNVTNIVTASLLPKGSRGHETWPSCRPNSTSNTKPACSLPPEDLPKGRFSSGTVPRDDGIFPKWINLTLAKQGQTIYDDYKAALAYSHVYGLVSLLGFPDIADVMAFTENAGSPETSALRYTSTMAQVTIWYKNVIEDDADDSVVLTSLSNTRHRHLNSALNAAYALTLTTKGTFVKPKIFEDVSLDEDMWTAFHKDLSTSQISRSSRSWPTSYKNRQGDPIPINQFAMAMTQFAFIGFPVLFPDRVGIDASEDDIFAFNHLWAVLGYALGIDDDYNIALQPDRKHVRIYYQQIFDDYFLPAIFTTKYNFKSKMLIESTTKAFQQILPIFSPKTILLRLLRDILEIEIPNMTENLSMEDQVMQISFDIQYLPVVKNHAARTLINAAVENYLTVNGKRYYGANYSSQESIAKNVYTS